MDYKLYTDIIPVNGYCRSAFYDFGKEKKWIVPNSLVKLIAKNNVLKKEIQDEQFTEYFNFLLEQKLIFKIPKLLNKLFPKINPKYFTYSFVNHLIIEINQESNWQKILIQISLIEKSLYCYHLIIIFDGDLSLYSEKLLQFLGNNELENFVSIGIKATVKEGIIIENLVSKNNRINNFFLVDELTEKTYFDRTFKNTFIYKVPSKIDKMYNTISADLFAINLTLFSESQEYNAYFNKKLYIEANGNIKNSPESEESFGNINEINSKEELLQIISDPKFKKYWRIPKSIIDVCKSCEFRHMCVDNRLPVKRNENEWFHLKECQYNPYIAKWKGENGYKTLAESGVSSTEDSFTVNKQKLNQINKKLWGDD